MQRKRRIHKIKYNFKDKEKDNAMSFTFNEERMKKDGIDIEEVEKKYDEEIIDIYNFTKIGKYDYISEDYNAPFNFMALASDKFFTKYVIEWYVTFEGHKEDLRYNYHKLNKKDPVFGEPYELVSKEIK